MKKKKKIDSEKKLNDLTKQQLISLVSGFLYKDLKSGNKKNFDDKKNNNIRPGDLDFEQQFIREVENFQEKMVFNGVLSQEFIRELEKHQEKIFKDLNIDKQFVIEVEDSQEKLAKTHAFSTQFVREIEKNQEKMAWTWALTKEFIKEVESNQEKLSIARNQLTFQMKLIINLEKIHASLMNSETLTAVDGQQKKFERLIRKAINELEKVLYRVS